MRRNWFVFLPDGEVRSGLRFFVRCAVVLLLLSAVCSPGALQAQPEDFVAGVTESAIPMPDALTLWDVILWGGWAMVPLAILSFVATVLIFTYLLSIRRGAVVTGNFMATAEALLRKKDLLGLLAVANRRSEAVARVTQRALEFATKHPGATFTQIREVAETEGTRQASLLNQRITYLADIGAIAPMLGLLGTVFGMIRSFSVLANDVAASRPMLLAEGVGQALVTTAAGLVVGIPAMIFYSFFRGQVQKLIAELEAASTILLAQLSGAVGRGGTPRGQTRDAMADFESLEEEESF